MSDWEIIKQSWWIVVSLILGILGAIGGIIYLKKFWIEKISPRLHRLYETIKSKIPKGVDEMTKEELKQIASELRGINEKLGDILKLKKDFEVLKGTVLNETEGVRKDISDKIKNVQKEIEKVKFNAEIKRLNDEEKKKLSVSCVPKFEGYYPPSIEFDFEINNSFEQSFILDRLFYEARAGANKKGSSKIKTCEDVYFDKRVVIQEGNKTKVSKISMVSPIRCDKINENVSKGGKYDIEWGINIEMFFEGDDGLKLLSDTLNPLSIYAEWEQWYKMMKDEENKYWEKWYKKRKGKEESTIVS
ncbi:MAG: hypothetical protein KAU16_06860 [Methanophagales archaeon]|nr:hypothetical protein [Methanophagales archaeon]